MNFFKKRWKDILFIVAIIGLLAPKYFHSSSREGQRLKPVLVKDLNGNPVEIFKDEKKIYLFWATWCGPCHLQMKIIKNSIEAGTITKEQVRAISMAENVQTVREYQNKENWPFEILVDDRTDSWQRLEIQGTPSIMFVENAVVTYFSTGISPLLQLRLKLSY